MSIVKASDLDFSNKKIKMIIAGYAGIGKSTLALSAPKPLLFDADEGIDRVEAKFRKDTVILDKGYEGLLYDLDNQNFDNYGTFIFDTGGKLLDLMKPYVIKKEPKNGQRDGSLTIKGWGAIKQEWKRFTDKVSNMGKHIIYIFHTVEERDGDITKLRIAIEGSAKNKIWESMDLGGFVEMQGKNRTIGFSNCERYYAKATHGIKGIYQIPKHVEDVENDFLTTLFDTVITDLQKSSKAFSEDKEIYDNAMNMKVFVDSCVDLEQINKIMQNLKDMVHALTSERELKNHLVAKAKELGFKYDKDTKAFI